jgi:flavin-dependent thymidylate synthase
MKVTLLKYDEDAMELLLFTKQTRLKMAPTSFEEIKAWPMERKLRELEYMRKTIKSSWEFTRYVFVIEGVTRACTHQLVRTRTASFAQQSQRSVDMSGFPVRVPPSIEKDDALAYNYDKLMKRINQTYEHFLDEGIEAQDARGILPTDCLTNITMSCNLRTLHEMGLVRLCVKTQGEYQDVFRAMREEVLKVHPWAEGFIRVWCAFYGTCAFPNTPAIQCPVKPKVYNRDSWMAYDGTLLYHPNIIHRFWEGNKAQVKIEVRDEDKV